MRRLHKLLGILMLAPLLLWALTGAVFLFKPGYSSAYEQLSPKLYPIEDAFQFTGADNWSEITLKRTVLGYHLLVLEESQWKHLDPVTLKAKQRPTPEDIRLLVTDALGELSARYGNVSRVEGTTVFTDSDVVVTLDWDTLSLHQEGPDTYLINSLYKIHYLQWFNSPTLNQVLGVLGLLSLVVLSLVGTLLLVRGNGDRPIKH